MEFFWSSGAEFIVESTHDSSHAPFGLFLEHANSQHPTGKSQQSAGNSTQPTTNSQQAAANSQQPTSKQTTASSQQPTSKQPNHPRDYQYKPPESFTEGKKLLTGKVNPGGPISMEERMLCAEKGLRDAVTPPAIWKKNNNQDKGCAFQGSTPLLASGRRVADNLS